MKIVLCNQKGGSGKTTLTVLMASALAEAGHNVAVLDRDPQQTATRWLSSLEEEPKPSIATPSGKYDFLFIDTPGTLESKNVVKSIAEADQLLLTTSPSPADLWSSQDAAAVIKKNKAKHAKAHILFNRVVKGAKLSQNLQEFAELIGLPSLSCVVPQRQCFQHSAVIGWKALPSKERAIIQQVTLALMAANDGGSK